MNDTKIQPFYIKAKNELLVLLLTILFGLMTVLMIQTERPWMRLLLLPLMLIALWKLPVFKLALRSASQNRAFTRTVLIIVLLIAGIRLFQFGRQMISTREWMEDIPYAYRSAAHELFIKGKNPYSVNTDYASITKNGKEKEFKGIKYTPLQIFTYAPFILVFGMKGVYIMNLLAYMGIILVLFYTLRTVSLLNALTGVLWFLASDHIFTLCFHNGTNDIFPVLLSVLSAVVLARNDRNSEIWSGILLGFSGLAKQLPAALYGVVYLLQRNFKAVLVALVVGILGCLPFIIADPNAFWANVVEFNLIRPARQTSFLYYLPQTGQIILQAFGMIVIILLSIIWNRKLGVSPRNNYALLAFATTLFLVFSKMAPLNYFFWLTPFMILWLLADDNVTHTDCPPDKGDGTKCRGVWL